MGDPPKHDNNKKNGKSMPPTVYIGAGAGCLGMGGIVLFGGALVTAALVSALAIKTSRQRRSSSDSDAIKKSRSASPETQTVDAPNQLELMMKTNKDRESSKDFSPHSSPQDLRNWSDGETSMKEMQTKAKPNQNLTLDKNQNSGMDHEEKVDSGDSNEEQESTLILFDSVSESEKLDNGYEKAALECEEQEFAAAETESGFPSCSEILVMTSATDDGGEEQKYCMLIDNENDERTDGKSLVSSEAIEGVPEEDQMAVEVEQSTQRGITVEDEEEIPTGHAGEDQETVFMNEAASVNQVKVENKPPVQFLEEKEKDGDDDMIPENCEGDLIDEAGFPDGIVREEAINAACLESVNMEDILEMGDDEAAVESQEMQHETAVACIRNLNDSPKVAVDDDNPPTELMHKEETAQEQATTEEKDKEGEIPDVELIEAAKVDVVREDINPPRKLMNKEETAVKVQATEDEWVKKEGKSMEDETGSIGEAKEDVTVKTEAPASEPWNLKSGTWLVVVSIWCICHWYSELPFPEVSLVGSLLFILMLLGHRIRNRTRYLLKYE